jgi:hypothetical protein
MAPNTQYQNAMIKAHVPEADQLTFGEALDLAETRNQAAAQQLAEDAESQLDLEAAAAVCNDTLDSFYENADLLIGEFGVEVYLN